MNKIRTIAMYLPQFHRVQENDQWWGEGFTEWTAVKAARPLFKGHKQPKIPQHSYYYNLLDKGTMEQQSIWMHDYGIDGLCFYHYYFGEGKMVLEKPAENLLKWKDIDMPFCFSWANGSWTRTWSNLAGNSWADTFEKNSKNSFDNGILLKQKYGREEEWTAHFMYLLPFFQDRRYITLDGHPVFIIYDPWGIPCLYPMMECWGSLSCEHHIPRPYYIGMTMNDPIPGMDASILHAPPNIWGDDSVDIANGVRLVDYQYIWNNIIGAKTFANHKFFFEGVANVDDTPRRGTNGVAIKNFSIDQFRDGMRLLYNKSMALGNEFIFINAWNEWGEGAYLEPDEENGTGYLQAVKDAKIMADQDIKAGRNVFTGKKEPINLKMRRDSMNVMCLNLWMILRENGQKIDEYFNKNQIHRIVVYGFGILGKHFIREIEKSNNIEIACILDQRNNKNSLKYKVVSPTDLYPDVDAIIVTVLWDFGNIFRFLRNKYSCRIISLMEIIYEMA